MNDLIDKPRKRAHLIARPAPDGSLHLEGKKLINLASWDVFCLKENSQIKKSIHRAVEEESFNRASSRVSAGVSPEVRECEIRLAKLFQMEDCILFSSRNQAVFSLITNLYTEGDLIIHGDGVDAPIIDACVLCGATPISFDYSKPETLEEVLRKTKDTAKRQIVFLENFNPYLPYSYDLSQLLNIVSNLGLSVILDESYSFSSVTGFSLTRLNPAYQKINYISIINKLDTYLGSFGCSLTLSFDNADRLINNSRYLKKEPCYPYLFALQILSSFDFLFNDSGFSSKLLNDKQILKKRLTDFSVEYVENPNTNFISIVSETPAEAARLKEVLFNNGFLTDTFSSPLYKDKHAVTPLLLNNKISPATLSALSNSFELIQKVLTA